MTRYAVGDVQGCLQPLKCLLDQVSFNPANDQLWFAGDLINRGPDSLDTLRFIKNLGPCTRIVLGNHDLHLLAVAYRIRPPHKTDTLDEVLQADDCEQLMLWLRQQRMIYSDPSGDYTITHAGIPPIWTLQQATQYAQEVEAVLKSEQALTFLKTMYGNHPERWDPMLDGWQRLRLITNYLTRMRFCRADGTLDLTHKEASINQEGFAPWFSYPSKRPKNNALIFGHWAALQGHTNAEDVFALDTGCVWGHSMTLMNLDTRQLYHCHC